MIKNSLFPLNGNLVVIENNFGQQGGCITCNKTTREVHVSFALSFGNDTMQSGGLIYTFNSAFAPKTRKSIFGMAVQGGVLSYAQLVIHPNGEMRYHGSIDNASLMFFNGSYIYG